MRERLSDNFTLFEMCWSETANRLHLRNEPRPDVVERLRALCENVLQPIRDHFCEPVIIHSGYRSPDLNAVLGGAANSQHQYGEAADFHVKRINLEDAMRWIAESDLPFDQAIIEPGWIHISHAYDRDQRREALRFDGYHYSPYQMGGKDEP
jgi:hypothetical protein